MSFDEQVKDTRVYASFSLFRYMILQGWFKFKETNSSIMKNALFIFEKKQIKSRFLNLHLNFIIEKRFLNIDFFPNFEENPFSIIDFFS